MSLAELFSAKAARRWQSLQAKKSLPRRRSGPMLFEPLEPRVLLSATPAEVVAAEALQSGVPAGATATSSDSARDVALETDSAQATAPLNPSDLLPFTTEAIHRLAGLGFRESQLAVLPDIDLQVIDLPGWTLATVTPNGIALDRDAAGHGWFLDRTPTDDMEFARVDSQSIAGEGSEVQDGVDLLTVLAHEFGHYLGLDHSTIPDTSPDSDGVSPVDVLMQDGIRPGIRRIDMQPDGPRAALDLALLTGMPMIGETLTLTPTIVWRADAVDGFWDTAANWLDPVTQLSRVPTSGDDVSLGGGRPVTVRFGHSIHSLSSSQPLDLVSGSLTISGEAILNSSLSISGGALTTLGQIGLGSSTTISAGSFSADGGLILGGSAALTISGGALSFGPGSQVSGQLTIKGGLLSVNSPTTLTGNTTWSAGTIGGTQKLTNAGTLMLTGPEIKFQTDLNIDNAGTMLFSGGDLAIGNSLGGGSILRNLTNGTILFQGDGGIVNGSGNNATPHHLENAGVIRKTGGTGISHLTMFSFDNTSTGTLDVQTGTVQLGGERGVTNNGALTVSPGATIDLTGGGAVGYTGNLAVTGGGTVLLQSGSINAFSGQLALNMPDGMFQWTGGAINVGIPGFATTITNLGTMTLAGANTKLFGGTLTNQGTIIQSGTGNLELFSTSVSTILNNAGTYDLQGDGGITTSGGVGGNRINNSGTFRKSSGAGTSNAASTFNNTGGTIDVQSGTLALSGGGTDTGGVMTVDNGAVLHLTGAARTMTGKYSGSGQGAVQLNTNLFIGSSGATFDFADTLFQWINGNIDGGSTGLTNVSAMTIAGLTCNLIGILNNAGVIIHTGPGQLALFNDGGHGAILANLAGGLYEIRGDGGIIDGPGNNSTPHTLRNLGTIRKSSGTGISRLTPFTLVNDGTIEVQTGTVQFGNARGMTSNGNLKVAAGATIDLTGGGSFGYAGSFTGTGAGTVLLKNGSVNALSGTLTFDFAPGLFQWTGGAINVGIPGFATTITNLGTMTLDGANLKSFGGRFNNRGTVTHRGTGDFELGASNAAGTVFSNEGGAFYDMQSDASVTTLLLATSFINSGTLKKSDGTGTSSLNISFSNIGTVEVRSGTLSLSNSPAQLSGTTLTGGAWNVFGNATLAFPAGSSVITNSANVMLSSAGSNFAALAALASNSGALTLSDGRDFTSVGDFTNSGSLTVGPGSHFAVTGNYTPSSGLVGWWHGDGDANDAAGGNNGTLQGNTTFAAGQIGQAFQLDGNEDGIDLGNPANLSLQNFTISAWIKRNSGAGLGVIFSRGSQGYGFGLYADGRLFLTKIDSSVVDSTTLQITDTAFHHVAVTKTDSQVIFYLDGVAENAPAYNPTFSGGGAAIGYRPDNRAASFSGTIDEVAVFNRALDASAINTLRTTNDATTAATPPTLNVEISGSPASGQFGAVTSTGNAALSGTLNVILTNGFGPTAGDGYTIMSFAGRTGSFDRINGLTFGRFTLFDALFTPTSLVLNGLLTSPDLAMNGVDVLTANASPGQDVSVSYRVNNLSSTAATGDWYDSIYRLSADWSGHMRGSLAS